jgi:hypothetical protein
MIELAYERSHHPLCNGQQKRGLQGRKLYAI